MFTYSCFLPLLFAQVVSVLVYRAVCPELSCSPDLVLQQHTLDKQVIYPSVRTADAPLENPSVSSPVNASFHVFGDSQTKARRLIDNYIHPNQFSFPTGKSSNILSRSYPCLIALEPVLSIAYSWVVIAQEFVNIVESFIIAFNLF